MTGMKGLTLSVRNLPKETEKNEVQSYFNGVLNGAQAFVGSLVKEPHSETKCATVTLVNAKACKKAREKLQGKVFRASAGTGGQEINLDHTFYGITPLAEYDGPQFDYYFVHGIGGHAFETFASPIVKKHEHAQQKMWARDLLPKKLGDAGLQGRFSTIGYNAKTIGGAETITIEAAAKDLLLRLQQDRPEGSQRPIFFVAHSLGGLVLCQALVLSLQSEENQIRPADRLRLDHLVKGVVFMGTPFWGSYNARTLAPFVKALANVNPFPMNTKLVDELRANSTDLVSLVASFNQVRKQQNIDIKVFFESKPLITGLVTRPESAAGPFSNDIDAISIDDDHIGMVKFSGFADQKFRDVGGYLLGLTQKHIGGGVISRAQTVPAHVNPMNLFPARSSTTQVRSAESSESTNHELSNSVPNSRMPTFEKRLPAPPVLPVPASTPVPGRENQRSLNRLADWKTTFVIDDTNSMVKASDSFAASQAPQQPTTRWEVLVRAMQYLTGVATRYNREGVDVHFLCSDLNMVGETSAQRILNQMCKVRPEVHEGGTYLEGALHMILHEHMIKYRTHYSLLDSWVNDPRPARQKPSRPRPPKPLNILVLTGGDVEDKDATRSLIVRIAKELEAMGALSYQLGIQFVQFGDDKIARKYLKMLDDQLENGLDRVRDIVDTRRFSYPETEQVLGHKIVSILLGAMDRSIDKDHSPTDDSSSEEEDDEDEGEVEQEEDPYP